MSRARDISDGKFANDLTVDTNTLHVDAANNRVGVGTASPSAILQIDRASANFIRFADSGSLTGLIGLDDGATLVSGGADGDMVIRAETSGKGVVFAGNGATRFGMIDADGLKFNTDTAAANALDDYEFGDYDITLTPSSSGSITPNSSENKATYVKIGNFVQAQGRVLVSSVSSPAGDLAINLPFNTTSSQGEQSGSGAPSVFVWSGTQTNNGLWAGFFDKGTSAFYIRWGNSATPSQSASYIQAGTEIRFSVSYITDS